MITANEFIVERFERPSKALEVKYCGLSVNKSFFGGRFGGKSFLW